MLTKRYRRSVAVVAALCLLSAGGLSGTPSAAALSPGGTFVDDDGNHHEGAIEAVASAGITRGCNPAGDRFCPAETVSRGQMAAFLRRALDLPAPSRDYFSDDNGSTFEDDINRLAEAAITLGCDQAGARFCPTDRMTRQQMAAFLVRSYHYSDDGGIDFFGDDESSPFEDEINKLAHAGVTLGCAESRFCPTEPVRRDQMASFLARAEGLEPIVPPERCPILPADDIWNRRVDGLPVDAQSDAYVASIGLDETMHADFGSGVWPPGSDGPIGIPFVEVGADQAPVTITFTAYGSESDPGPYPIPADAPIEGGPNASGDRHVLVLDSQSCVLYELYSAWPQPDGSWEARSGAVFDLRSSDLRPDGWTSADAAGLPILPGLVRYDEVASGSIDHAIRVTAPQTQSAHVWPARHDASSSSDPSLPPMGLRLRLKTDYDISGFSADVRVILTALRDYGMILADNGSSWSISGAPDERWDNGVLHELERVPGSAFEAVDVSGVIVDPNSGQASP